MTYLFEVQGHSCVVDDQDAHWVVGKCLSIVRMRSKFSKSVGHVAVKIGRKKLYLHRLIMGTPAGMMTDHLNGKTLDNRRANLRICTRSQNGMNRGPDGDNPNGLKGIKRVKGARIPTWTAKIKVNGKAKHLGSFRTPEEAHAAYCNAAPIYHGEFARTA